MEIILTHGFFFICISTLEIVLTNLNNMYTIGYIKYQWHTITHTDFRFSLYPLFLHRIKKRWNDHLPLIIYKFLFLIMTAEENRYPAIRRSIRCIRVLACSSRILRSVHPDLNTCCTKFVHSAGNDACAL